jgi:Tfp pilus assembly protein PilO
MNRDRLWVIGAALGTVVVVVMGWFLGVSPLVAQASTASSQQTSLAQANTAATVKLATLKTQFANIDTLQTDLAALRQSIPGGADLPGFITEINGLCAKYHVSLSSVVVNDAVVFQAPVAAVAPATPGSTATPAPTPTPTPTTAGATAPVAAAPSGTGLVLVPVAINVTGSFADVVDFTGGVQAAPRLYLATEVEIAPGASVGGGRPTAFLGTLSGNIYALAGSSGDLPASTTPVTPVVPTPTPTPTSIPTVGATAPPTTAPSSTPKP